MRDSFIFYRSFYEAIKDLPREVQGEVYTAIMEYSLNGTTTEQLKPIARSILTIIKPILDANNTRFKNGCNGGPYGHLGGAKIGNKNASKNNPKTTPKQPQNNPKTTPNKDVNVNVNVNNKETISKDIVKKNSRFSPPSIEDVEKYILEKKYNVSAEAFHAFYESNGWYVGPHKMKDWHAAIVTWEKRNNDFPAKKQTTTKNVNDIWGK